MELFGSLTLARVFKRLGISPVIHFVIRITVVDPPVSTVSPKLSFQRDQGRDHVRIDHNGNDQITESEHEEYDVEDMFLQVL